MTTTTTTIRRRGRAAIRRAGGATGDLESADGGNHPKSNRRCLQLSDI
jgi:hypothetical protein